ncbi:MAG: hypothetical protein LBU12_06260 [Deltaproteobacteria bacterium]|nr:hypothetical protein [Deltaproteobacteria bacterium]
MPKRHPKLGSETKPAARQAAQLSLTVARPQKSPPAPWRGRPSAASSPP